MAVRMKWSEVVAQEDGLLESSEVVAPHAEQAAAAESEDPLEKGIYFIVDSWIIRLSKNVHKSA